MCVEYMNRRFWGDRRVISETWDGETKYEVSETEAEREARLKKWEQYLETGEEAGKTSTATTNPGSSLNGSSVLLLMVGRMDRVWVLGMVVIVL